MQTRPSVDRQVVLYRAKGDGLAIMSSFLLFKGQIRSAVMQMGKEAEGETA